MNEPTSPPADKQDRIIRTVYLVFIILFLIASIAVAFIKYKKIGHYKNLTVPDGITDYYWNVYHYPTREAEDLALPVFMILSGFYLLLDYFVFYFKKGWKKALFVVISMVVILGGTEAAFRIMDKRCQSQYRPHPVWLWRVSPNLKKHPHCWNSTLSSNKFGFRNRDFPMKKPPGQFRIMLVGDSSALGFGVDDDQTFAYLLQEKLEEKYPGKDILVINAASGGTTTTIARAFLEDYGWKFEPDALIVSFNNDHMLERKTDRERITPPLLRPFYKVLYNSNIYLELRKLIVNEKVRRNPSLVIIKRGEKGKPIHRVPLDEYEDNIKYFSDFIKKRGGRAVVIQMPKKQYHPDYPEALEKAARENGCVYVDAASVFDKLPKDEMFIDYIHPTVEGHKIIGDMLFDAFEKEKMPK